MKIVWQEWAGAFDGKARGLILGTNDSEKENAWPTYR